MPWPWQMTICIVYMHQKCNVSPLFLSLSLCLSEKPKLVQRKSHLIYMMNFHVFVWMCCWCDVTTCWRLILDCMYWSSNPPVWVTGSGISIRITEQQVHWSLNRGTGKTGKTSHMFHKGTIQHKNKNTDFLLYNLYTRATYGSLSCPRRNLSWFAKRFHMPTFRVFYLQTKYLSVSSHRIPSRQ